MAFAILVDPFDQCHALSLEGILISVFGIGCLYQLPKSLERLILLAY